MRGTDGGEDQSRRIISHKEMSVWVLSLISFQLFYLKWKLLHVYNTVFISTRVRSCWSVSNGKNMLREEKRAICFKAVTCVPRQEDEEEMKRQSSHLAAPTLPRVQTSTFLQFNVRLWAQSCCNESRRRCCFPQRKLQLDGGLQVNWPDVFLQKHISVWMETGRSWRTAKTGGKIIWRMISDSSVLTSARASRIQHTLQRKLDLFLDMTGE